MNQTETNQGQALAFLRGSAGLAALVGGVSLLVLLQLADGSGRILGHYRILRLVQMVPVLLITLMAALLLAATFSTKRASWFANVSIRIQEILPARGWLAGLLLVLPALLFPVFLISPLQASLEHIFPGIWFAGSLVAVSAVFLHAARRDFPFLKCVVIALLPYAVAYQLSMFLPQISDYPFSLAWSESSQYYFASTFSRLVYGTPVPLPVINPSYELLMSVPFLIHGLPVWVHRLWTVLLWVGLSLASAHALSQHFRGQDRLARLLFTGWGFLYLLQIPVYFHLLACVLLVLAGFTSKDPRIRLGSVLLASAWAGISRINWFPLPGFLAAAIYLLETRMDRNGWRYFRAPCLWIGLGTGLAFGVNALYMVFSGNPASYFSSAFTSELLWYRLLPSPTNPLGVLLQVVIFAFSLCALLGSSLLRKRHSYDSRRLSALAVSLGIFFLGGLAVSAKIGGGNNIHNLDAFFVLLWVAAGYLYFGRFTPDTAYPGQDRPVPGGWFGLAALIPILAVLPFRPLAFPVLQAETQEALASLQSLVDRASGPENGEVLFLSERQLLAFGKIQQKQLVADYDKIFLMEMAMAGNQEYFDSFYHDLRSHRFTMIVSEPIYTAVKGRTSEFGEENDAWVKWVSEPLLQEYEMVLPLKQYNLEVFVPKQP